MAVTLKFQSSGMVPGDGRPVVMRGGSLTVGRGPANDLVLPDPDRMLSKNHFVIEDHNGNIVIVDLSTNGTFLNYSKIPLGRTPTPRIVSRRTNYAQERLLMNASMPAQVSSSIMLRAMTPLAKA